MSTDNWYQQQERGAGSFRLNLLFFIYRVFGARFVKIWVWLVATIIGLSAKSVKEFSRKYKRILNEYQTAHNITPTDFTASQHIRIFADSLVDKMIAMCDRRDRIKFTPKDNTDWREFQNIINKKRGAFLICCHIGNIEALAAFPDGNNVKIHAFQQVGQTGVFHNFISRHSVRTNTTIHPVEDMNIGTASEMFDALNHGDLVMMAGDRISATNPTKTIPAAVLGRACHLPLGVFKFAKSMSHPVFAVALLNTGHEKYTFVVKQLDNSNVNSMASEFANFMEKTTLSAPTQWFNFYNFFQDA